jgi:hypothetical protein
MKLFSQMSRPMIDLGLKIRSRRWPEDYYIRRDEEKIIDSIGNVFFYSWENYFISNQVVLDNAGPIWEVYDDLGLDKL